MLGLAAVGLSLVYGTTGISNFAHGEMVTFGAIAALVFVGPATLALPIWLGFPLAVILSAGLGLVLDMALWRPLRRKARRRRAADDRQHRPLARAALHLPVLHRRRNAAAAGIQSAERIPLFGVVSLERDRHVSIAISIVVIVAFAIWLTRSRIGKATRAISDNPSLAAASGIDVDFVVRVVWVIAGGLAGLAGILYAYFRPGIRWDMGAPGTAAHVRRGHPRRVRDGVRRSCRFADRGHPGRGRRASGSLPTSSTRAHCSS